MIVDDEAEAPPPAGGAEQLADIAQPCIVEQGAAGSGVGGQRIGELYIWIEEAAPIPNRAAHMTADAAHERFIPPAHAAQNAGFDDASVGAPLGIAALLKAANLVASNGEGSRMIEQGGVRIDGAVVSDKGLKVAPGTCVVQVGKRKFARVTLSA